MTGQSGREGQVLQVLEIFDSIQGEGYWSGVPMTFVRLAGCNAQSLSLDCVKWCDTPQSWSAKGGQECSVEEVARRVTLPTVCLTGGEPLLQGEAVQQLAALLRRRGVRIHLETNGTLSVPCDFAWVTVSPKPPQYVLASDWKGRVNELKFIVEGETPGSEEAKAKEVHVWEKLGAVHSGAIVCLQPEYGQGPGDFQAQAAVQRAFSLVMSHPGWRLSLQLHKYLGVR